MFAESSTALLLRHLGGMGLRGNRVVPVPNLGAVTGI